MRWRALFTLMATMAACSDAPFGPSLAGPDRGDPARYVFALPTATGCSRYWSPPPGVTQAYGLFDVIFGGGTPPAVGALASMDRVREIVAHGGTVVYRFHGDRVRAILPLSVASTLPLQLIGVTNAEDVSVGVSLLMKAQADPGVLTSHGGVVTSVYEWDRAVYGRISDRLLPWLRMDTRIAALELTDGFIVCPGSLPLFTRPTSADASVRTEPAP